jgi:DNA-binding transcriptional regulator YiaG
MRTNCKRCNKPTDPADLIRCQSAKHRHLSDAFCADCAKKHGKDFHCPFYCLDCHPDEKQPKKREKRPVTAKATGARTKSPGKEKNRHGRLIALRKALGFLQPQMAVFLGISPRQYQDWEYDEACMPRTAKVLCWHVANYYSNQINANLGVKSHDLCLDWPEGNVINLITDETFKSKEESE